MFWRQVLASDSRGDPALKDAGHRNHFRLLGQEGQSWSGREPNVLWQNRGDNTFDEVGNVTGLASRLDSRGMATGDLDGDGDLDIVVFNRNSPLIRIFRNDTPVDVQGTSLLVDLVSPGGQTIGALVTATCGDRQALRQVEVGSGFMSQNASTLHFGLGACTGADTVEVRWPSGRVDTWRDLPANRRVTLTEGSTDAAVAGLKARNYNEADVPAVAGNLSAPVPEVTFDRLGGDGATTMADLAKGIAVLNYWATWCVPCQTEMPELVKLSQEYGPKGVPVVGVTMDRREDEAAVREFLGKFGVTYDQVWGEAEDQAAVANLASAPNGTVPMTVVLKNGLVRYVKGGPVDEASMSRLLDALAAE